MEERVNRVRTEARISPNAKAGSRRALKEPQKLTDQPGKPPAEKIPSFTDMSKISRIPSQNSGVANPNWVK